MAACPLAAFVAGLPSGGVPWSPWPCRAPVVLVACPSRAVARSVARRGVWLGLRVAGPLAVSRWRWLVAVAVAPPPPAALSARLGAGQAGGLFVAQLSLF